MGMPCVLLINSTQTIPIYIFKVNGPFVQTFCIEKDSYMDAI